MICPHCAEPILSNEETRDVINGWTGETEQEHLECFVRQVVGSVGHQKQQCSCYGRVDTTEDGLSVRECARRAFDFFQSRQLWHQRN